MKTIIALSAAWLFANMAIATQTCGNQLQAVSLPSGEHVVVSQPPMEPCSIGSYALRVYRPAAPEFPYDSFVGGLIRARDGTVAHLTTHDIDGDGSEEIIVIIRNAGSGGYLSADAIRYQGKQLTLLITVAWLHKDADPIPALLAAHQKAAQQQ